MNTRKLTALALVLALLAFPVLSLGEKAPSSIFDMVRGAGRSVKATVTFEPGEAMAQNPSLVPVADLLKVLRLEAVTQQDKGAILLQGDMFLNDKSSMSITELVEQDQVHIKSNLFGDKALSFTPEEYIQMMITQMEAQGADEAMVAAYKAYMEMYASLMKGELPDMPQFDQQSMQQDLVMPLTEWFTNLISVPEVTTGTFESDKHDTATMQMVYSLSAAQISDLLTIVANWAGKDVNVDTFYSYMTTMNPNADITAGKAEFKASMETLAEDFLKKAAPAMPEPFTVTTWLDGAGNLVALEAKARIFGEDKEKPKDTILAGYYTKAEADGVSTRLTFDVTSGSDSFAFAFSIKEPAAQDGCQWHVAVDVSQYGMDVFGMKLDYAGRQETTGLSVKDSWKLGAEISNFGQVMGVLLDNTMITAPSGADIKAEGRLDVYLTGQSAPIASALYNVVTGEPVEVPDLGKDSIHPGKMTAEELEAWARELSMNMMMQMSKIMQNLPPSVLSTMNGATTY